MHEPKIKAGFYSRRMKIFAGICIALVITCLARLGHMQMSDSPWSHELERLKKQKEQTRQFKTVRGTIFDRNGFPLAEDIPIHSVQASYLLTQYTDTLVIKAKHLKARIDGDIEKTNKLIAEKKQILHYILKESRKYQTEKESNQTIAKILAYNRTIWRKRMFQAWRHNCQKTTLYQANRHALGSVPYEQYKLDFEQHIKDPNTRLLKILDERILEMWDYTPLFDLTSDEAVVTAEMEFSNIEDIKIATYAKRDYPQATVAAQTIGWVGKATQPEDLALFAKDPLARYQDGEVCGREDGIEYVCESILRGRRGIETKDLDNNIEESKDAEFGRDIHLTLDIALQKRVEERLHHKALDPNRGPGLAAVIIDIQTAEILTLASIPTYDLNAARDNYGQLLNDTTTPLKNRALSNYKPGSTAKPLVLAAALEEGVTTPESIYSCPSAPAEKYWPNCWIWRKSRVGHDVMWKNTARNAIKGSCNIYLSRVASKIPPRILQKYFWNFGYGHQVPLELGIQQSLPQNQQTPSRHLRQAAGKLSRKSLPWNKVITSFEEIPPLDKRHRRFAGIGEGEIQATMLQIANSMATLARQGTAITPVLFKRNTLTSLSPETYQGQVHSLGFQKVTIDTIWDGMYAVINETGGTAHDAFKALYDVQHNLSYLEYFTSKGITVYGKTGSTEDPDNALFAAFALDQKRHGVAIALIVEGGVSGSADASPIGADLLVYCVEAGYLGTP